MAKPKPKPRAAAEYALRLQLLTLVPRLTLVSLFNNPILSDVTIKQIYKGKVREYRAHKAILCADSSYFHKAFTGNFRVSGMFSSELRFSGRRLTLYICRSQLRV